jgi:hypothetical protein
MFNIGKGKKMISKELLSEVLGLDVYEDDKKFSELLKINSISDNVNYNIRFLKDIENGWTEAIGNRWINTHELDYKCKEWALDNGYEFVEDINVNRHSIRIYNCGILVYEKFENYRLSPSDTFKACQWILAKQIEEDYQEYKIVTDFTNTYCEVSELHYDELSKLFSNKYQRKSALSFAYFSTSMEGKDCPTFALRGGTSPLATMRAENLTQIHYNTDINEWVFTEDKEEYTKIIKEGVR